MISGRSLIYYCTSFSFLVGINEKTGFKIKIVHAPANAEQKVEVLGCILIKDFIPEYDNIFLSHLHVI